MRKENIEIYKEIFFSFLLRDEDFPAVVKSKGYSLKGAIKVIYNSVKSDFIDFFLGNNNNLKGKVWLYVESVNQLRAIEFLTDIDNSVLVSNSKKLIELYPEKKIYRIVHKTRIFYRLIWLRRISGYKNMFQKKFQDHFKTIFKHDGVYESLIKIMQKSQPKAVIMSNDHNAGCRALLFAGKVANIRTIYIQHAAVTEKFPPLRFDLSLLEGEDSLIKYRKAGKIEGSVELVGMPKFDQYFKDINKRSEVKTVGIALNNGDNFSNYYQISDLIKQEFQYVNFVYRFHPSINPDKLVIPEYAGVSKIKDETSFEFLKNIDVLFAGNSSIHLEATLMNVVSVYIEFEENDVSDYYGFLNNNLVDKIPSKLIISWFKKVKNLRRDTRRRAKLYVDTVDSKWDGKSTDKVLKLIDEFLSKIQ